MMPDDTSRSLLLCRTPGGPILVFSADSVIGRSLSMTGSFGEEKISEVLAFLERSCDFVPSCFVDIGANIGTHVLYALDSCKFDKAIAIEADPNNFLLLTANIALRGHFDRTRLIQCALSDKVGTVQLELCSTNYGDHRVRVSGVIHDHDLGESAREVCQVPTDTADHLFSVERINLEKTLVWMDTQGHEGHILAGAVLSICSSVPAVVMEFWPYGLHRAGGKEQYFKFLKESAAIYDINRPDWSETGRISVEELDELYEMMLQETRQGHYPHTDLLCVRPAALSSAAFYQSSVEAQSMNDLERCMMSISCRDSDTVPKVTNAGKVFYRGADRVQLMHNGVEVVYGGYYGEWMAHIIRGLNGHHEPQEELIFHVLLRYIRNRTQIVELGSFWAYYTMWFLKEIPDSVALCVEPDALNMEVGRRNAVLNGCNDRVRFISAWIGGKRQISHIASTETSAEPRNLPMLDAGSIVELAGTEGIELLHLDIQGAELPFLESINASTASEQFRFIMVSTHHSTISGSTTTHCDCVEALRSLGATILVEHDVIESFSGDGLILASMRAEDRNLWFPAISRNRAENSLFKQA